MNHQSREAAAHIWATASFSDELFINVVNE